MPSQRGGLLDLFAGSSSTLVAARALGRHAVGIEKRESQCEAAALRLAQGTFELFDDYARDVDAGVLVKGIRSQVDVAYESPMAIVNRHLADIETVFLLPDPAHALVSSSLVRQVASLGGDVSPFVPPAVAAFLDTGARGI